MDFAGPIEGKMFLIVVDTYTKWLEVRGMPAATSSAVIGMLHHLFATFGIPSVVCDDNRTAFCY